MRVDVRAINCDFYVFSGHKVFAPTGIGVVFGKSEVLDQMPPWQCGGNMIQDVTFEKMLYQPPPQRFEAGTGNIADAIGLGAAIHYLDRVGIVNVSRHEHVLLTYATAALQQIPGLRIIGTAKEKASVISFVLEGFRTEEIGDYLNRKGIAVRSAITAHSRFCATLAWRVRSAPPLRFITLAKKSMRWSRRCGICARDEIQGLPESGSAQQKMASLSREAGHLHLFQESIFRQRWIYPVCPGQDAPGQVGRVFEARLMQKFYSLGAAHPLLQCTTISRLESSSCTRVGRSPSGIRCPLMLTI